MLVVAAFLWLAVLESFLVELSQRLLLFVVPALVVVDGDYNNSY